MAEFFQTIWPYLFAAGHILIMCVASAHVVLTKRDVRAAIGWVGIIWLTPYFGSIIYLLLGINRIHRRARILRRGQSLRDLSPALRQAGEDALYRALGDEAEHLAPLSPYIGRLTKLPLLDGNRVVPLFGGQAAYAEMLAAIDAAQTSIALMTYIFDNDQLGRRFIEALARAKDRGCQVRLLIDDVGARYTWPTIKGLVREHGIKFATFMPTLLLGKLHYTNLRLHRKIMIVDGRIGFTGGMNIRGGHLCEPGSPHQIRDTHFRLDGPIVAHLREVFALDWEFSTGEPLEGDAWFPPLEFAGNTLCRGIADGPEQDFDKTRLTLLGAIGCARSSIEIVTPYFVPDQPLISALNVAAMRGVSVNIVIPEKNNLRLVQWACTAQLWQVLQRGCRVWLAQPPFDHSKIMIVDGVWSLIGSANWDARSLRLNFEFNVECYDRELASMLSIVVAEKRAAGREITLAEVDGRPPWMRLRDGLARLAAPYL